MLKTPQKLKKKKKKKNYKKKKQKKKTIKYLRISLVLQVFLL